MNIDKICEQLTIDEKIRLLGGVGDWHTYDCNEMCIRDRISIAECI